MCLVVVINVRDKYNFPHSKNIPNLSCNLHTKQQDLTVHAIGHTKANATTCNNVGVIFNSILSEPYLNIFLHILKGSNFHLVCHKKKQIMSHKN